MLRYYILIDIFIIIKKKEEKRGEIDRFYRFFKYHSREFSKILLIINTYKLILCIKIINLNYKLISR